MRHAFAVLGIILATVPALQAQEEAIAQFVAFKTAVAIDEKCHFFRRFELDHLYTVEYELLGRLNFAISYQAGKMHEADYQAEYDVLTARGAAVAADIACTDEQAAAAYIIPLRGDLARPIYADLLLAFELGDLSADQQQAARLYESMVAPLYGQNWQGFVQQTAEQARYRVEEARQADLGPLSGLIMDSLDPFGSAGIGTPAALGTYNLDALIDSAVNTATDILFEFTADQAGYRLLTRRDPESYSYIYSLADRNFIPVADMWANEGSFSTLEEGPDIFAAFVVLADGGVRVMTYGENARRLERGTVAILVQPEDIGSDLANDFAYQRGQQWWDAATVFRGERVPELCLGGPCFALPPETLETLLNGRPDQSFRFFFSVIPDRALPPPDDSNIHTGHSYMLFARQAYAEATAQP